MRYPTSRVADSCKADRFHCRLQGAGNRLGTALLVAAALLVLVLLVTGCHQQVPGGGPSGRESVGTSRIDSFTLLQPTELGPGWRQSLTEAGKPPWPWHQHDCPAYRPEDYRAQKHRRDAIQRFYQMDGVGLIAHHVVETYEPGWAEKALNDMRRVLRKCASYALRGSRMSFMIVDPVYLGGAGLLVRGRIEHVDSPATVAYFVTVRRGDALSTLNLPDPGDVAAVETVAARQAARLG